jgi:ribosomal protein S18 acetylase RimI-like enzyme
MSDIRVMTSDDLDQVVKIEEDLQPHPWPRSAFEQAIKVGQRCCVVVDESGVIVGYGVADRGHGRTIAARNPFAAAKLYRDWFEYALNSGVEEVYAEIEPDNVFARVRLEKHGLEFVGIRPNFYGPSKPAEVYRRTIKEAVLYEVRSEISGDRAV